MESVIQDVRHSLRFLKRNPLYTLVVVFTLAIGIGANSAIFSMVNAVLLRPLPFRDPDRIVVVWEAFPKLGFEQVPVSAPNFFDWKEQNRSFEDLAAVFSMPEYGFNLALNGAAERVPGGRISSNLLSVLGIRPVIGRSFSPEEDRPGGAPAALISHRLWKGRFGSDPTVAGRKIVIDSKPYIVVGVLPPQMATLGVLDVVVPTALNRSAPRGDHIVGVMGRLKPGVEINAAQSDLELIERRIATEMGMSPDLVGVRVIPVLSFYSGPIAPALLLLQVAVAVLLLIACANVGSLALARAAGRTQELCIRVAIGAARGRLVRQLLTESLLLALLGGGLGLILAEWGITSLRTLLPDLIPRLKTMSIDGSVLLFTFVVSLLTGVLFGLLPAWRSGRQDVAEQLKAGADRLSGSVSGQRIRSFLLAAEIGLTLVLAIGAGLLVKSFRNLVAVSPGFRADNLLTMGINLPDSKYGEPLRRKVFMQTLVHRLESLPGVQSAAAISLLPLRNNFLMKRSNVAAFAVEGRAASRPGEEPNADYRFVTSSFFETMHIPFLQGRGFTDLDTPERPRVAIINAAMARRYFAGENPIGKRLRFMPLTSEPYEIVGVAGDVHLGSLADDVDPAIYIPFDQQPRLVMSVLVRTATDPTSLAAPVRRDILALDAELPVSDLQSMDSVISGSLLPQRLAMVLMSAFACFALILGILGVYGLTALVVNQRTREIGLRMALGARDADVLRMILGRGLTVSLLGTGAGLTAALALAQVMEKLLFGVASRDPWVYGGVTLVMIAAALLAAYIPARRATRISPMTALHCE